MVLFLIVWQVAVISIIVCQVVVHFILICQVAVIIIIVWKVTVPFITVWQVAVPLLSAFQLAVLCIISWLMAVPFFIIYHFQSHSKKKLKKTNQIWQFVVIVWKIVLRSPKMGFSFFFTRSLTKFEEKRCWNFFFFFIWLKF